MGRYDRPDADEQFRRDMVIVFFHPDYRDLKPIDALSRLYEQRREHKRHQLKP